jgi:LacI family transcriptional regulator
MKKRPTIRDVARQAGLSISTVSLVLNNKEHVSEETRRTIQRAIDELGYHPQRSARGLASRASGNIGFLLSDEHFSQAEPFYTKIFLGTEFAARDLHYYILLTTVGRNFNAKRSVPRFLLERNVDGVIVAGKVNERLIDYIATFGIPVLLVDFEFRRKMLSSVLIDNRGGITIALDHLIALGHRDIGFIAGDIGHPSMSERHDAFRDVLASRGITPVDRFITIDAPDTDIPNGFEAARKILGGETSRPTAVVAANDAMAIGCVQYARSAGIKIPDDLSLVGFDDVELCLHTDPPLTTIRVFKEEMGRIAVQRLVDVIRSQIPAVNSTRVPVELVVRGSTQPHSVPVVAGDIGAPGLG